MPTTQPTLFFPTCIKVSGNISEPGLNGTYERVGKFRGDRHQWMKPKTRCYIRWIRNRWELYVSHHPNGTTYFYNEKDTTIPPLEGWLPTLCVGPEETLGLTFLEETTTETTTNVHSHSTKPQNTAYTLYINDTCPYVQQIQILLAEMKILNNVVATRQVDIFAQNDIVFPQLYKDAYPLKYRRPCVPLLTTPNDGILVESSLILDYLNETLSPNGKEAAPSFQFANAKERYSGQLFIHTVNKAVTPCIAAILNAPDRGRLETALNQTEAALSCVNELLTRQDRQRQSPGPFFCGRDFSMVEIRTAPHFQRLADSVSELCADSINEVLRQSDIRSWIQHKFPRLGMWLEAVLARPSVMATWHPGPVRNVLSKACVAWSHTQQQVEIETLERMKQAKEALKHLLVSKQHI